MTDRYDLSVNLAEDRTAVFPDALKTQADELERALSSWKERLPEPTWKIFFPEVVSRLLTRYDYQGFEQFRPEKVASDPKFNRWKMTGDVYTATRGFKMDHSKDFASTLKPEWPEKK